MHLQGRVRARLHLQLIAPLVLSAGACGDGPCTPGWLALFERAELDRPILALWGDAREVWAVGGPVGADTLETLVMHWDGDRWTGLDTGRTETLWWVWSAGGGGLWMVGERGLVLRWDGSRFTTLATGVDATLFGVWGSADDDVWIVGGNPGGGTARPNDVVLHWDGERLTPDAPAPLGAAFFKVWGAGRDDVWVVGEGGVVQRRTAAGWQRHDIATRAALTTVHGCAPDDVWAVGGQGVFQFDGGGWRTTDAMPLAGANGVFCSPAEVLVVGNGGLKLRLDRAAGSWRDDSFEPPFYDDYHAAWIAPSGALWAAGGNYNAPVIAGRHGILGFRGCPVPR